MYAEQEAGSCIPRPPSRFPFVCSFRAQLGITFLKERLSPTKRFVLRLEQHDSSNVDLQGPTEVPNIFRHDSSNVDLQGPTEVPD